MVAPRLVECQVFIFTGTVEMAVCKIKKKMLGHPPGGGWRDLSGSNSIDLPRPLFYVNTPLFCSFHTDFIDNTPPDENR